MRQAASQLPLGAVRGDDGAVVVPESRRADGSVRKAIRIRQGYVPQDEVAKYKPIGQRLREQQAKAKVSSGAESKSADAVADQLDALTITPPVEKEREQERKNPPKSTVSAAPATATSIKSLKNELSTVNRTLREIAKLEAFAKAAARGDDGARPLTEAQTRKVARKPQLEQRREEIIEALNSRGATDEKADETEETKPPRTLRVIEM